MEGDPIDVDFEILEDEPRFRRPSDRRKPSRWGFVKFFSVVFLFLVSLAGLLVIGTLLAVPVGREVLENARALYNLPQQLAEMEIHIRSDQLAYQRRLEGMITDLQKQLAASRPTAVQPPLVREERREEPPSLPREPKRPQLLQPPESGPRIGVPRQ